MIDCFKTENYLAEKKRMSKTTESGVCKVECTNCLLSSYNNGDGICCTDFEMLYPKKAIEVVQRWSDEHPGKNLLNRISKSLSKCRSQRRRNTKWYLSV